MPRTAEILQQFTNMRITPGNYIDGTNALEIPKVGGFISEEETMLQQAKHFVDTICTYDFQNYMKTRRIHIDHALSAGTRSRRIKNNGENIEVEIKRRTPERVIDFESFVGESKAFFQMYAVSGEKNGTVATTSGGLYWHEETPFDIIAVSILGLASGSMNIERFGNDKMLVFIESNKEPEEMLQLFVDVPRKVYRKFFSDDITQFVDKMQDLRSEALNPSKNKGKQFIDYFHGKGELAEAFQYDKSGVFLWKYIVENTLGNPELVAKNPDGARQTMKDLALKAIDEETKNMLLRTIEHIMEFLTKERDGKHLYGFQLNFSDSVGCCRSSFLEQMFGSESPDDDFWDPVAESYFKNDYINNFSGEEKILRTPGGIYHEGDFCKNCNKKKGKCTCNKKEENQE